MKHDIDQLIHGYLDDSLTNEEIGVLNDWIKADPNNAKRFAEETLLHDRLGSEIRAASPKSNVVSFDKEVKKPKFDSFWLAVAATVIFLIGINVHRIGQTIDFFKTYMGPGEAYEVYASLVRSEDAVFDGDQNFVAGASLGAQILNLVSGTIRLHFDSGVEVSLQGPAEYEIVGPELTRLGSGLVTVNVPPGAEGFRVDTHNAKVTDLGTSFGLRLDEDGVSHISVFEGEVEVETDESEGSQLLKEGEGAIIASNAELKKVEMDTKSFEKVWPVSLGITGSSGSFQLAPPWPRKLTLLKSSEYIYLVPDGYLKSLSEPLNVNMTQPGKVVLPDQLTPGALTSDRPVRSFLLHYQSDTALPKRFAKRLEGSLTFDSPILGIIVLHEEFRDSLWRFSRRKAGAAGPRQQLDLNGLRSGDWIELSEDRRTLTVSLMSFKKSSDHIRVIVDASGKSN